ncbi:MAG: N-acetylmuramic acid 6-phosphate etherase [Flavobacteriales bacterium]|nr:N-acetylmuramic acid 6-phosphate etherase [Flavobacteriales bacterium]
MHHTTESDSHYDALEHMSTAELLQNINREDQSVPVSIAKCLPEIEQLIEALYQKMKEGGRLFYIGSGTSGRLGIVDASECPPTYGVEHGVVVGIIAGGDGAIRKAVEHAEDDREQGWEDLKFHDISSKDFVVGISASGRTPYVVGALQACKEHGVTTGSIACNTTSEIGLLADFPVDCPVGPEFVTGSTRMKSGTAQKLILNMITTTVMIKLGRVKGNKMVDMQLSNNKLIDRGIRMICEIALIEPSEAEALLKSHGSVRKVLEYLRKN